MDKLKLCPFCGGNAKPYQDMYGFWLIQCTVCGIGTLHRKDKKLVIEAWNRRANNGRV